MTPTKKPTFVLTHPFLSEVIDRELRPHARVIIARTPSALKRALRQADVLMTRFSDSVDDRLLSGAPKLRVVANCAVGVDNIDRASCRRRGIAVVNTPDVLTRATAELTLALLMAAARRIPEGEAMCRAHRFPGWAPDMLLGLELQGRNAVLVGQGRIGRETGRLFRALGLKVQWITRKDSRAAIARKLKRAQILSLHVPLTMQTRHWLNAKRLALLPPDAIVINTTRGPVVDEGALIRALKGRKIFAAGLDVYEREPEIPRALTRLSNVVLLPHLGSATVATRQNMVRLAIQGALGILSGKRPWNQVKSDH